MNYHVEDTKILIAPSSFAATSDKPVLLLEQNGFELVQNPYGRKLTAQEVLTLAQPCVGIIAGLEPLDQKVLSGLPQLRCISRCGVGVDNIDMEYAKELNVNIKITPDGPTDAVSELTIGLTLSLLRRIAYVDRQLRNGHWIKHVGSLLGNKTVGILGVGRIGLATAKLFKAFGARIIGYDPKILSNELFAETVEMVSFKSVLQESDVLSLHAASSGSSQHLIGKNEFALMKKGAHLVNAARGNLIDENALYEALTSDQLAGAALDVYSQEPYQGKLIELDNVVLTTHIGSYAKETRERMELEATQNLLDVLMPVKGEKS